MMPVSYDLAIVGAGAVGAFHALAAGQRGLRTVLFDRHEWPRSASTRNFGMIVPSAIEGGPWLEIARASRQIYSELLPELQIPYQLAGTQYVASTESELQVLHETADFESSRLQGAQLLDHHETLKHNDTLRNDYAMGSLWFPNDIRLEPTRLLRQLLPYLSDKYSIDVHLSSLVHSVEPTGRGFELRTNAGEKCCADQVLVCSGADCETLFPDVFDQVEYCKLQMLRTVPQSTVSMQSPIASGLSLHRYEAFREAPSWEKMCLDSRRERANEFGIHVLVVQDDNMRLIIGDSHQYDSSPPDDWLNGAIEDVILEEAARMVEIDNWRVEQRWSGVYASVKHRQLIAETHHSGVHIVTGLGGKGMTLSPGLAQQTINPDGKIDLRPINRAAII